MDSVEVLPEHTERQTYHQSYRKTFIMDSVEVLLEHTERQTYHQ